MAFPWNANRRFLIDECLSPDLVSAARVRGHDAGHVAHLGKAGFKDWYLLPFIIQNDLIFVTNNARDFRRLYADLEVHPGLVIILPSVKQPEQEQLFTLAMAAIEAERDIVNVMVEVDEQGTVTLIPWPPA
jgi:predicted nuclease of predicted toxin-antitoxin system